MPFFGLRTAIWSVFRRQHKSSHVNISWMPNFIFCNHFGWSMHWGEKNGGWQFGGSRQDREKWKLHDLIRCPRLKTFIPPDPVRFKGNCQCTVHQLGSSSSLRKYMSSCKSSRKTQIDSWDPLIKKRSAMQCNGCLWLWKKNTDPVCIVRCSGTDNRVEFRLTAAQLH